MKNILLGIAVTLILALSVHAEDKVVESYTARVANMGGAISGPFTINIHIYGYTSDEEVAKLAGLLKSKGQDAVASEIFHDEKGRIVPVGRLGNDLNYIRVLKSDKGKIIRMVSARPMSFLEVRNSGRSMDYPFGIVELVIGNDGKIEGSAIAAAKIQLNKDNILEVESFSNQPLRLMTVEKSK